MAGVYHQITVWSTVEVQERLVWEWKENSFKENTDRDNQGEGRRRGWGWWRDEENE